MLDDSIKARYGKKMPGVSSHFDHTSGRKVMGQRVLTLGLSCEAGFVPLDSELFTSGVKAQGLHQLFKEAKQNLGFLKEQSNHYAAYAASIHLAAIRFCLLAIGKATHQPSGIANIRKRISGNAVQIGFAAQLWQVFRALISGALDELKVILGDAATLVMETIESHIQGFFVQALQLDTRTLRLEAT